MRRVSHGKRNHRKTEDRATTAHETGEQEGEVKGASPRISQEEDRDYH